MNSTRPLLRVAHLPAIRQASSWKNTGPLTTLPPGVLPVTIILLGMTGEEIQKKPDKQQHVRASASHS